MITCARMNNLPMIIRKGLSCAYDYHDNDNSLDARDTWLFQLVSDIKKTENLFYALADDIEFRNYNRAEMSAKLREIGKQYHWHDRAARSELKNNLLKGIYENVD